VASVSQSSDETLNIDGLTAAAAAGVAPRAEPYLTRDISEKPALEIYDGERDVDLDRWLLEDPEESFAWIRAHKHTFVDVEAQR